MLHLFLEAPRWEEGAMERAKQMYLSHYRSLSKGLERATADRVMGTMLGPDRCALRGQGSDYVSQPLRSLFKRLECAVCVMGTMPGPNRWAFFGLRLSALSLAKLHPATLQGLYGCCSARVLCVTSLCMSAVRHELRSW